MTKNKKLAEKEAARCDIDSQRHEETGLKI